MIRRLQLSNSNEKRHSLIRMVTNNGISIKEAAATLEINYSSARSILSEYNSLKQIEKKYKGGSSKTFFTPEMSLAIEDIVSENPQYFLKEIQNKLHLRFNSNIPSVSSINRCLINFGITMIQILRELDRVNAPLLLLARKVYSLSFNKKFSENFEDVFFADESGFNLHLQRSQGRSRVGTRANVILQTVRGRTVSLIAAISISGMVHSKVITSTTVNAEIFKFYFEELCYFIKNNLNKQFSCIILEKQEFIEENSLMK